MVSDTVPGQVAGQMPEMCENTVAMTASAAYHPSPNPGSLRLSTAAKELRALGLNIVMYFFIIQDVEVAQNEGDTLLVLTDIRINVA